MTERAKSSFCDVCGVTRLIRVNGDRWTAEVSSGCVEKDKCYRELFDLVGIIPAAERQITDLKMANPSSGTSIAYSISLPMLL